MSQKSSILSDYFGKLILKEVRGISFEVRAWANIIKDVIDSEYKKYSDYNFMGDFDNGEGFDQTMNQLTDKRELTVADLLAMNKDEIDNILAHIMDYHKLKYERVINLKPNEAVSLYNQIIDKDKINKESEKPITKSTQIIINGRDYPEAFAKFSVDKWVISDKQPTEYDHVKSGYQDNGEYVVFINCGLNSASLFVLIHEIKHAYQDWQRMSKGKPPIRQSKEMQQLYTKDFEKFLLSHQGGFHLKTLDSVIYAYYVSSDAEIAAYLEGAYDDLHGGSSYPQFAGKLRELGRNMANFKASQVDSDTPPKSLQKRWAKIIEDYNIPLFRKFKNVFDFLKYTERKFNKKGQYIVKKVDKLRTIQIPRPNL